MADVIRLKPIRPCPICGKPSSQAHSPFCSGRCQDIDLNRWLSGSYVVPAPKEGGEGEEIEGASDESDEGTEER